MSEQVRLLLKALLEELRPRAEIIAVLGIDPIRCNLLNNERGKCFYSNGEKYWINAAMPSKDDCERLLIVLEHHRHELSQDVIDSWWLPLWHWRNPLVDTARVRGIKLLTSEQVPLEQIGELTGFDVLSCCLRDLDRGSVAECFYVNARDVGWFNGNLADTRLSLPEHSIERLKRFLNHHRDELDAETIEAVETAITLVALENL